MPRRIFLLFCLLLSFCVRAFPAVFVVTTNADSGPGTLRDALARAAANGSTVKDSIVFNIADTSQTGRTITLQSMLPFVSSNLVIDGTGQAGSKFGPSDARIQISFNIFNFFAQNFLAAGLAIVRDTNVEVYGLYIANFYEIRNAYQTNFDNCGIYIKGSQNITIGAPGKGNWLAGSDNDIEAADSVLKNANIKISANYIGLQNFHTNAGRGQFPLYGNNIVVGGDTPQEGNHITSHLQIYGNNLTIKYNYLGVDGKGVPGDYAETQIDCDGSNNVEISYNDAVDFRVAMLGTQNFKIFANRDVAIIPSSSLGAVALDNCSNGIIGSDDERLKNIFHTNSGANPDFLTITIVNYSSNNIQVLKNEIICSREVYFIYLQPSDKIAIPKIQVLVNNANEYSGTASPNSKIYIYQDTTDCPVCSPVKFDTVVMADASGSWKITGNFATKKWIANAWLLSNSSEFTQPLFSSLNDYFSIVQPSCGKNNGSIAITKDYKNVLRFEWYNASNQKIGDGPVLNNVGPGAYYAKGFNGLCFATSVVNYLFDVTPKIIADNVVIKNPSCRTGGAITGLVIQANSNDPLTTTWKDANGKVVGNMLDITKLTAGTYTFSLTDTLTKCVTTYGPITLKNGTGPSIDQSQAAIQSANCSQSDGSITNITATGNGALKFSWKNDRQQEVATAINLTSQPAGTYTLQVTDDSQCGAVFTTAITIPEINSIILDESAAVTSPAGCNGPTGSVRGIAVTGATRYQWADAANRVVAATVDLQNAAPGTYTFTASNAYCSKTSKSYTISQLPPTQYPAYPVYITLDCFGKANGSVTVEVDTLVKIERWANAQGQTIRTGIGVAQQPAGIYFLYLTDKNGCETLYGSYTIPSSTPLVISAGSGQVSIDQCGLKVASIKNIKVSGGVPPYTFQWVDLTGNTIATSQELDNVGEGTYILRVNDATTCGLVADTFKVENQNMVIPPPLVSNLQLCSAGEALLTVNNPSAAYTYRLYAVAAGGTPIAQQANGRFKISAKNNTSFYLSTVSGTCESDRVEVQVSVGLSAVDIDNAFSPNGDGLNDSWKINGIENYPNATVQVFARSGQKVFESKGYGRPFNGTYGGKNLPVGVYYYVINLSTNCSLLSGSLTILR